jgi:hypothetical protein
MAIRPCTTFPSPPVQNCCGTLRICPHPVRKWARHPRHPVQKSVHGCWMLDVSPSFAVSLQSIFFTTGFPRWRAASAGGSLQTCVVQTYSLLNHRRGICYMAAQGILVTVTYFDLFRKQVTITENISDGHLFRTNIGGCHEWHSPKAYRVVYAGLRCRTRGRWTPRAGDSLFGDCGFAECFFNNAEAHTSSVINRMRYKWLLESQFCLREVPFVAVTYYVNIEY